MLTVLIILLATALVILLILLFFTRDKRIKTEEISIPLSELAPIWLKYNKEHIEIQTETIENETKTEATELTETGAFWVECIEPYKATFQTQDCLNEAKELIGLIEKHGHNPSVVADGRDGESVDLISVRDNLAKVTLKEHTYTVGRTLIELIKEQYRDYETIIPSAVVAALTHDIGKIPEMRLSGAYNTYEHPQVSVGKLTEIFTGKNITWLKDVFQAVRDHHIQSNHTLTVLLKKADRQTRQMELAMLTKEYKISTFSEWFQPDRFLSILEPHINVTQTNRWQGFSFHGIVYFRPDFLYEKAKDFAKDIKVLDTDIIYSSEKESTLRKIVESLKKAGAAADILAPEQYARKFEVQIQMGKKQSWFLTPLRFDVFSDMQKIEARKAGQLRIESVRLL